mmetsp:Transcript_53672/g.86777  ORF Transcript_53672/g.86777 Transcript_53672/m.86777 type:complete len:91 (+) Transcript_53672:413-685(+)
MRVTHGACCRHICRHILSITALVVRNIKVKLMAGQLVGDRQTGNKCGHCTIVSPLTLMAIETACPIPTPDLAPRVLAGGTAGVRMTNAAF